MKLTRGSRPTTETFVENKTATNDTVNISGEVAPRVSDAIIIWR